MASGLSGTILGVGSPDVAEIVSNRVSKKRRTSCANSSDSDEQTLSRNG